MAPPDFGRSVNPISARGARLCPPNNTGTPRFSDLPTALPIDTEVNEKEDSIIKAYEKNDQSLVHAKTLNSGENNEKSAQNTNDQEESNCLIKKEHCDDQAEYETYDFFQYETSDGVPFLETYEANGKNEHSLVHAKTLNSGGNNGKLFQNTNEQEESDCLIKKEHCDDRPEYETYDFIQCETSECVPFLETYESVTVEQLIQITKNEFKIELTSNILKSIEDSVIDSVLKKLNNGPATVD